MKTQPDGKYSISSFLTSKNAKSQEYFGENNLKSVIYRHKIYIIKEQFSVPLNTPNQGRYIVFASKN
jgi:hypothetical protein